MRICACRATMLRAIRLFEGGFLDRLYTTMKRGCNCGGESYGIHWTISAIVDWRRQGLPHEGTAYLVRLGNSSRHRIGEEKRTARPIHERDGRRHQQKCITRRWKRGCLIGRETSPLDGHSGGVTFRATTLKEAASLFVDEKKACAYNQRRVCWQERQDHGVLKNCKILYRYELKSIHHL